MSNLMEANYQWANRPNDERCWDINEFEAVTKERRENCHERDIAINDIDVITDSDEGLKLRFGKKDELVVSLTNLAFGQLATRMDYPAGGLDPTKLPTTMIRDIMNERFRRVVNEGDNPVAKILFEGKSDKVVARCITTDSYTRFWDNQLVPLLRRMETQGWVIPPARPVGVEGERTRIATEKDVLAYNNAGGGIPVKIGDPISPAGIYSGDRDSFVFMINQSDPIDDGGDTPLFRGRFVVNSETGTGAFSITDFLFQGVCGNHIIWDVQEVVKINYRHVGDVLGKIHKALDSAREPEHRHLQERARRIFSWMRKNTLGSNKQEVVENIYSMRLGQNITQDILAKAMINAEAFRQMDGDPFTWYGAMNAVTRYSQQLPYASLRRQVDTQIGRITTKADKLITV